MTRPSALAYELALAALAWFGPKELLDAVARDMQAVLDAHAGKEYVDVRNNGPLERPGSAAQED